MERIDPLLIATAQSKQAIAARLRGNSRMAWLACGLALGWLAFDAQLSGQELRLEIVPEWEGNPVVPGETVSSERVSGMSLSRVDGLLSRLGLRRADGSWLESDRWHVYFSAEKRRLTARADGLPAEEFQAIRFQVGLDAETDASDPQEWPADHPLNPSVCGLHWGWRSGYVFLALEGHWTPAEGKSSGFSYHLAGAEKPMTVELPVTFSGGQPTTIRLGMDVAKILAAGDVVRESSSTHSRSGDSLAATMKARVSRSFRVKTIQSDLYQMADSAQPRARPLPSGVTPLRLSISERLPKVKLPEDNPLTVEGVELGRQLFNEPRLSRNNAQ
ncbi:MAG: hypothetical protein DME21_10910, partial [Verrucomicrobia bacterium]